MNKYIIITARSSSSRLKKKILKKITATDLSIDILIKRAMLTNLPICLATSNEKSDNYLVNYVKKKYKIKIFRGNKDNKIKRWYDCMNKYNIDVAGLVDGDDLAFDYELYGNSIMKIKKKNIHLLKFPKNIVCGVFTYIISFNDVKKINNYTKNLKYIDVIEYYLKYLDNIREIKLNKLLINQKIRLTLDYKEDLKFFQNLYKKISYLENSKKIIKFLNKEKKIKKINFFLNELWRKNQLKEIKFHEKVSN
tara:strand:+ start:592 stop:1344 length:753 start_codon:yes stop_codon:yes gene_type:complete